MLGKIKWSYPDETDVNEKTGCKTKTRKSFEMNECDLVQLDNVIRQCIKDGYDVEVSLSCKAAKD